MDARIHNKLTFFLNSVTNYANNAFKNDITHEGLLSIGFVYSNGYYSKVIGVKERIICVVENEYSFVNNFTKKPINKWRLTIASVSLENTNSLCKKVNSMNDIIECITNFDVHHKSINILLLKFVVIISITFLLCLILAKYG